MIAARGFDSHIDRDERGQKVERPSMDRSKTTKRTIWRQFIRDELCAGKGVGSAVRSCGKRRDSAGKNPVERVFGLSRGQWSDGSLTRCSSSTMRMGAKLSPSGGAAVDAFSRGWMAGPCRVERRPIGYGRFVWPDRGAGPRPQSVPRGFSVCKLHMKPDRCSL